MLAAGLLLASRRCSPMPGARRPIPTPARSRRSSSPPRCGRRTSASSAAQRHRARRGDRAGGRAAALRATCSGLVPNLNWSGGTSRPRYFQLRGIGELEQYQGAPNPSVGFLIDDIDFSGVGMPATTVRRRAGRSAARPAGHALRRQRARRPDQDQDATIRAASRSCATELSAGGDGLVGAGLVAGGALGGRAADRGAWRLAAQRARSDGFRRNAYLGRDDTNGRDETHAARQAAARPRGRLAAGVSALYVDLDNGFDAFSPDNSLRDAVGPAGSRCAALRGASLRLDGDLGAGHAA